jgi:hypothetical protein
VNLIYHPSFVERRRKPRIHCDFFALVRGKEPRGVRFEGEAILSNISANGMYLKLQEPVAEGDKLFVYVRLGGSSDSQNVPMIAAAGEVVRVDQGPNGKYGVAVNISKHRFL